MSILKQNLHVLSISSLRTGPFGMISHSARFVPSLLVLTAVTVETNTELKVYEVESMNPDNLYP